MSMFDWSSSALSSTDVTNKTVSTQFWIYWAVTIPLTLSAMVAWRLWWLWQERKNAREMSDALELKEKIEDAKEEVGRSVEGSRA